MPQDFKNLPKDKRRHIERQLTLLRSNIAMYQGEVNRAANLVRFHQENLDRLQGELTKLSGEYKNLP